MKKAFLISTVFLAGAHSALAQDEWSELSVSTGFEYTSGDYGGLIDTDILYVPFTVKFETSKFQLRATAPWLRIEGPGSVVGGPDGGVVIGPGGGGQTSESGFGDIIVAATYNLYPSSSDSPMPYLELTGKVKIPTADENDGLGTGKADFTVQLDAFKAFGAFTPFATVGYRFRGNPELFDVNDSFLFSAGGTTKLSEQMSVGASYDFREASTDFSDNVSEISPFVVFKPNDDWSINAYGVFGLSDGSPDHGGGLQLRRSF